jgi:hypothetical protein
MADITKCMGIIQDEFKGFPCPYRITCYRYTAEDTSEWQSYFEEVPYNMSGKCCIEYMKI